ncbi:MAG: hypothetical protein ACYC7D_04865 [Nitrososphaerales archaeon]
MLSGGDKINWSLELNNMIPMGIAILTFAVLYGVLYADKMRRSLGQNTEQLLENEAVSSILRTPGLPHARKAFALTPMSIKIVLCTKIAIAFVAIVKTIYLLPLGLQKPARESHAGECP